jgi:hypothetical protein
MQQDSRKTTRFSEQQSMKQHDYEIYYLQNKSNYLGLAWWYNKKIYPCSLTFGGTVKALRYKPEGRGIDSRWCQNFSLT